MAAKGTAATRERVRVLLDEAGRTYAEQAGIRLRDQPAPLWQLLVLANLLSARIGSEVAVAAARELFKAGGTTARGMAGLSWQQRVDALGRGHYRRYDESTSSRLGECADIALDRYSGDLRKMADEAGRDTAGLRRALRRFPGIGPTGVDIFCREAQAVWPWLRPYLDDLALKGAGEVGLPHSADRLAGAVAGEDMAPLAAGLVRVARDGALADRVAGRH
ncbi:endonuclease [Allonocardiopsis opalescens]|uniref:Endonuclease III n=1 Tax=Allonocardiopsis opalescens TaxID=1144618 RepID=A0A2T0PV71_9ACTN|nr:endonuclease [Allonocardiopsis opalescens]PRX95435.1 hypothetical protein CLV72_10942 [Allonocardiopsis opalescens]